MKKNTFFALVMFMSVIGAVFGQTPATLPYSCDFEAAGNNGWTLRNGGCVNTWKIGSFYVPSGYTNALFISAYANKVEYHTGAYSVVVAERRIQTGTSDSLTISFDLTVGGETDEQGRYAYDYLKVFWVPADTVYQASTSWTYYAADASYSTNVIMSNSPNALNYTLNLTNGVERMSVTIANEPNTVKKLVFVWKNDGSDGEQPGAIIDNISIVEAGNPCHAPTNLALNNLSTTSVDVVWDGTATGYEVRLNGGETEVVSETSMTILGLTAGARNTVEVRSICGSSNSSWRSIEFDTPTPLPYTCDFEASGDNGWTLKNGSCVNKWAITNYPDATNKVLAITAGSTVGYDIDERSVVVAEKTFQTGAGDSLTISFSVDVGGEAEANGYDAYDYLKVFWVPADTVYEASTSRPYYASSGYSTNILTSNNSLLSDEYIFLDVYNGAESVTIANEPYSLKKLVFVWVNDGGEGSSDGAIIDNISIVESGVPCDAPTALTVSNITETSADVSWNGTSACYQVRLNGGPEEITNATSKSFTDLTAGTNYTLEVRTVCPNSQSEWINTNFTTLAASGLADAESGAIKAMIYPNPAKDKATLSLTGLTANAKIIVSDLQGRIIQTEDLQAGTETYELNTSNYASGVYYIHIQCGKDTNTQKLVIE